MKRLIALTALLPVWVVALEQSGVCEDRTVFRSPAGTRGGAIDAHWIRRGDFGINLNPPSEFPVSDFRRGLPLRTEFSDMLKVQRIGNEREALRTLSRSLADVISRFPGTEAAELAGQSLIGLCDRIEANERLYKRWKPLNFPGAPFGPLDETVSE
ncbi:MAG: hypothetical protein U0992_06610 [Planctomycetaceae bacterium]